MDEGQRQGREATPPARASTGWGAALLIGLPALLLVALALLISASEKAGLLSEGSVLVVSSAHVAVITGGERPAERVTLPYQWDSHHPGERGSATFEASFDLPQVPVEPWAMQFPKIGNAYAISLNGSPLERWGSLDAHDGADSSLLPRHMPLGTLLRAGTNELTITIRADRGRDAGLSQIIVGPASMIREDVEHRYNWIVVSATAVTAISLGVGLLSLGFWRSKAAKIGDVPRPDEALYLYAALAELTEAVAAGASLVGSPPVPWPWWGAVWNTTLGASVCLMTLACVEIARWGGTPHARRLRRWLAALVLVCPVTTYASLGLGAAWAQTLWYSALGITVVGFALLFLTRSLRGAALEHHLLSIAIVANVFAGFHDFYAFRGAGDYLHITTLVYSSILFDLTLGAIVILRFAAANEQVRELMRTLSDRISERERELGESYRKLEQLARRQERLTERASILRDMHDGVGAHLSMALRQIESGRLSKEELLPPLRDALDQLKLTIDNVNLPAGDVASLMANLRYRLGPRIEASGIRLHWNVDPLDPVDRLDAQAMRQLMFVLFEAFSNALQHSRASELRVEAGETDEGVRVRVIDNGVGFDLGSSWERGLLTLKNRAEHIGSVLDIRSAPGKGTCVEVVIPRK